MNSSNKDPKFFLMNIRDSIQFIEEDTKGLTFEDFKKSRKEQDSVLMRLAVIGEAAKEMPSEIKTKSSHIPWTSMANLRDVIVHNYFGVKLEEIWKTVKEELPVVKKQINKLLNEL